MRCCFFESVNEGLLLGGRLPFLGIEHVLNILHDIVQQLAYVIIDLRGILKFMVELL
jgi:hypothetical protein